MRSRFEMHMEGRHLLRRGAGLLLVLFLLPSPARAGVSDVLQKVDALRHDNPEAAIQVLGRAIEERSPESAPDALYELHQSRAAIRRNLGQLESAKKDAETMRSIAERLGDPARSANALRMTGTIAAEQGDLATAIRHFHSARKMLEGTGNDEAMARITTALGVGHNFLEDYERARYYWRQALELARKTGNRELETNLLGNLALAAAELEGPEAGLSLHREALELARELDETKAIAYQLANMCTRLIELERLEVAEARCLEALDRLQVMGHQRLLAGTRLNLGDLLRARGRPLEALEQYEDALQYAESNVPTVELELLEKLADTYEEQGRPDQALGYLRRHTKLEKEMRGAERRREIDKLEVQHELQLREQEIERLELESDLQEIRLQRRNWMLFGLVAAVVLSAVVAFAIWRAYRIRVHHEHELAGEDPLTGLTNRRAFLEKATHEQDRARRQSKPLSVAVADIDHFKRVNDEHGHHVGDEVLRKMADHFHAGLRGIDIICRWGGEEFLFLLPDTDPEAARHVVGRLRGVIAERPIDTRAGPISLTLTYGIAAINGDIDEAIQRADRAMYEGKRAGRDRIVVDGK